MGIKSPRGRNKLAAPARPALSPERSESLIVPLTCSISKHARREGGTLTQRAEAKRRTRGWLGRPRYNPGESSAASNHALSESESPTEVSVLELVWGIAAAGGAGKRPGSAVPK